MTLYTVLLDATLYDTFEIEAEIEEVAIMKAHKLFMKLYGDTKIKEEDFDFTYDAFIQENIDD
jgi:hypothetical protein